MNLFLFLFFGIAPAIVWLLFYIREDKHPEPNWMVRKVFLWGMLATLPVIAIELLLKQAFLEVLPPAAFPILYGVLGIALVEELAKYGVFRFRVYPHAVLDEPVDVMLYMLIGALGFAAMENVLMLFGLGPFTAASAIVLVSALRFVGATFLHALASALFGYAIALSYGRGSGRWIVFAAGLAAATALHGIFNLAILHMQGPLQIAIPVAVILTLALSVFLAFRALRNRKGLMTYNP